MQVRVEKLLPAAMALAHLDSGEALLVPGALPQEELEIEVLGRKQGLLRGRLKKILSPSPLRVEPDCPLAGCCGGCDFIHVRPEAALALKSQAALGELAASYRLSPQAIASPLAEGYRRRAVVHLDLTESGRLGAGFYDRKRSLVEFERCRLLSPRLNRLAYLIRLWAAELPPAWAGAEAALAEGLEPSGLSLILRPQVSGRGLSQPPDLDERLTQLWEAAQAEGLAVEILSGFRQKARRVAGEPGRLLTAFWPQWDLQLWAEPGGFSQVNFELNRLMVEHIVALTEPLRKEGALDLYAGLGNISLPLARQGWPVTAVEIDPVGLRAARFNGRNKKNLQLMAGSSAEAVALLRRQGRRFELIIVDPPRAGAKDLAPALAALEPRLIIYLACQPSVLVRDLPAFVSLGYEPRSLSALDMFPRTSHLEALAVLARP